MPYWTLLLPRSPMYFPFHSQKPSLLVMTCALLPLSTEDRTGTLGELSQICPMHGSGLPPTPALPPFCVLFGKPPAPLPPSVVSSETPSCFPGVNLGLVAPLMPAAWKLTEFRQRGWSLQKVISPPPLWSQLLLTPARQPSALGRVNRDIEITAIWQ